MHIPDGYLSPQTYLPAYGVMAAVWAWAVKRLNRTLRLRQAPLLALGAAFSFIIMMFNIPIPGGTTGHAAGAVLIAVLLGPWAAVVAVSLALIVQAFLFGDGGITALGANCLNIAVVMPFAGWGVYRLLAGGAPATSRRHAIAAAVGGYVGLNAAALTTALMFGIQPLIAHDAAGRALYAPYSLQVALPAMMLGHLLLFGLVEAAVTGLVVAYLQRTDPSLLPAGAARPRGHAARTIAIALGVLAVLTPLGLYLPARFGAGAAWGEWGAAELHRMVGYLPQGVARLADRWRAPLPDYALPGDGAASPAAQGLVYIASAVIGAGVLVLLVLGLRRLIVRKDSHDGTAAVDAPVHHG